PLSPPLQHNQRFAGVRNVVLYCIVLRSKQYMAALRACVGPSKSRKVVEALFVSQNSTQELAGCDERERENFWQVWAAPGFSSHWHGDASDASKRGIGC